MHNFSFRHYFRYSSLATFFLIFCLITLQQPLWLHAQPLDGGDETEVATFAGGCFWCMEPPFDEVKGVLKTVVGYSGGTTVNPSYEAVSSGSTGHTEAIQVHFDPKIIAYSQLLDIFWRQINPTDGGGQFVDRGTQYRSEIFVHNDEQRRLAEQSKLELIKSGRFSQPIVTAITSFSSFYPAEDYHQDYYKTHPVKYKFYRYRSGRDQFLEKVWNTHEN